MNKTQERASVYFVTLGCAKNEVDTADMSRLLQEAGFSVCNDTQSADVIIVNTCSFIQPATEESIDAVLDALELGKEVPVIVAGCMPARYGSDLSAEFPEVAAFVPCAEEDKIVERVSNCLYGPKTEVQTCTSCHESDASDSSHSQFAYIKISDGCDRWCSYCTIPMIRGRYHSFSLEEIKLDVQREIDNGAKEIVLIGQDTGLWGSDFNPPSNLANLLGTLAEDFPDTWFRAMYTQPENVTDELLSTIAKHSNVAPYLDIPLQHVDANLLKAMNRKGSRKEFSDLIRRARSMVPDIALRTTLIAGFPGETEAMHEEMIDFIEEEMFDYVGVFPYSREEGTKAAELEGQLDEDEKQYRASRVRSVADAVSSQVISSRRGHVVPVIVEGIEEDGQLYGRAITQAPEVDGVTYLDSGSAGSICEVRITDTFLYDMEGDAR